MENSEDGKGITKGAVHDVPELKDLLRAGEAGNALGARGLFLRDANGALEFLVAGGEQSEAGKQPGEEAGFPHLHQGSFEGALEIVQNHGKERAIMGVLATSAGVGN